MLGMSRKLQSWQVFMQAQPSASQKHMCHTRTERSSTLATSHTIILTPTERALHGFLLFTLPPSCHG